MEVVKSVDPTARFQALLEQLRQEFADRRGTDWGWRSHVARQLHVTNDVVGKIERGERGVGPELIKKATEYLGVNPAFFFDDQVQHAPEPPPSAAIDAFNAAHVITELAQHWHELQPEDLDYLAKRVMALHYKGGSPRRDQIREEIEDILRVRRGEPDRPPHAMNAAAGERATAKGMRKLKSGKRSDTES